MQAQGQTCSAQTHIQANIITQHSEYMVAEIKSSKLTLLFEAVYLHSATHMYCSNIVIGLPTGMKQYIPLFSFIRTLFREIGHQHQSIFQKNANTNVETHDAFQI
jgi:hypothetical protein